MFVRFRERNKLHRFMSNRCRCFVFEVFKIPIMATIISTIAPMETPTINPVGSSSIVGECCSRHHSFSPFISLSKISTAFYRVFNENFNRAQKDKS